MIINKSNMEEKEMQKTIAEWRKERGLSLEYVAQNSIITIEDLKVIEVVPKHILLMNWLEVKSLCLVLDISDDQIKY